MSRFVRPLLVCLTVFGFLLATDRLSAQSELASVSGRVVDAKEAVVPEAKVDIINTDTNVAASTYTNREGLYLFSSLKPGRYRLTVSKPGFQTVTKVDLILHVQDSVAQNFALPLGSIAESVTVTADSLNINTTDAAVSTVVDRTYVENMPLNGRSFQNLILLTPGVVTNTPQASSTLGNNGEFSVNGQRIESNYYTVDGVSANIGVSSAGGGNVGLTGSVAGATALGTTQSLVSLDALEEFRVQTSTYSAEYGRNPGGQFSFVTRSGTNQWHGTAFDYLRNDAFDANNWFNNFFRKPEPPLRQNDFGGTLGGRVDIPRLYRGTNRTFFFFSYEGLRLTQPQAAAISYVPNANLRQTAPAPLRPVLNGFPLPNGPDQGNGLAQLVTTWSNPGSLDGYSVRFDQNLTDRARLFFRFSDSESSSTVRAAGANGNPTAPSVMQTSSYTTRTCTLGAVFTPSNRLTNDFRLNYSSNAAQTTNTIDSFGGATPVDLARLQQADTSRPYAIAPALSFGAFYTQLTQRVSSAVQRQWNLTDSTTLPLGHHLLKFGLDYRRLTPVGRPASEADYFFFSQAQVLGNSSSQTVGTTLAEKHPLLTNFSAFVQDDWRLTPHLNLAVGLRWDVNPAPGVTEGQLPLGVQGVDNLATMTLSPLGTPLWKTTWYNFAPRLGAAWVVRNNQGHETVLRAGGGLFFDTGQQSVGYGFSTVNYIALAIYSSASFPLPPAQAFPPINPTPPYGTIEAYPAHLQLPYTIQWNVTMEQALGKSQALSVGYVGSHAGRLLQEKQINAKPFNPNFTFIQIFQNGSTADYDALQAQFQRRINKGLSAIAAYTYAHSLDYGSTGLTFPYVRGNSDFDVRHTFSSAISYGLPGHFRSRLARVALHNWGLDDRFTARTGFPVTLRGASVADPVTGRYFYGGLNLVPGQPLYISDAQFPGGRSINPAAFRLPPAGQTGNAPRNFVRGSGAWQMDFAVRREFPIHEGLKLQFRAEAFNVFNHPNFGLINSIFGQPTFGQATSTLNTSLGVLSPLYQMGGPRSMQLALKLLF